MNCKHCGAKVPQTSRRERYYCDDNCRKAYSRSIADKSEANSGQKEHSIADKSISDNPSNKPNSNLGQKHISGVCYGCGEKQPSDLVDICHNCIAKGITRRSLNLKSSEKIKSMIPNYEKAGIHPDKIYNYIAYYLKLNEKKIGNATFIIKGRMFEIGRQFIKSEKKQPIPPEFKA